MKLLHVSEVYPPSLGGVPTFVESITHDLQKRGHDVTVFTTSPVSTFHTTVSRQKDGVVVMRAPAIRSPINPMNNWMTLLPLISATRVFFKVRPDCIHMHTPIAGLHRVIMFWAHLFKTPVVLTNHVMPENLLLNTSMSHRWQKLTRRIIWTDIVRYARKATFVTAPTVTAVEMLKRHRFSTPSEAVTNGVDEKKFSPGPANKSLLKEIGVPVDSWPKLIYVGRMDGEKRVDILLEAMPFVLKKYPNAHLILVGRGVLQDELRAFAKGLGIQDRVTFTGALPESQKPDILRSSDLFVISSPAELQCISGLEALATGIPIVGTDVAALVEMCQNGKNGYQFHYPDAEDLAHAIDKVFAVKGRAQEYGKYGRAWVVANHTHEMSVEKYESVYNRVVSH